MIPHKEPHFSEGKETMKRKFRAKPARGGSKRVEGISREVQVLDLQAASGISMDAVAVRVFFGAHARMPLQSGIKIIILCEKRKTSRPSLGNSLQIY